MSERAPATWGLRALLRRRRLFSVRVLLLGVHLLILAMAALALLSARLPETALLRQTEQRLLGTATLARAVYLDALSDEAPDPARGHRAEPIWLTTPPFARPDRPAARPLDMHRLQILPPPPLPRPQPIPSDPTLMRAAHRVGRLQARLEGAHLTILDPRGVVMAGALPTGADLTEQDEVRRALQGEHVRVARRCESGAWGPDRTPWCLHMLLPAIEEGRVVGVVQVQAPPTSLSAAMALHWREVAVILGVLLLAVALQSWVTGRELAAPLAALVRQAEDLSRAPALDTALLEDPGTVEVARLSAALVQMARTLALRADTISTFASHVSHELKTPLASIRGALELLQDHLDTMSPDERQRFLDMADRHAQRLERLVARLLELARADALTPGDQRADPAEALRLIAEDLQRDGRRPTLALAPALAQVCIDPVTLDSILRALIDNAHTHVGPDAALTLRAFPLDPSASGRPVVAIEVTDDGPGVTPANRARIFTPFFTTARDSGGTGLGLSVAAALAQAHHGDLALTDAPATTFRLTLPAA